MDHKGHAMVLPAHHIVQFARCVLVLLFLNRRQHPVDQTRKGRVLGVVDEILVLVIRLVVGIRRSSHDAVTCIDTKRLLWVVKDVDKG